MQQIRYAGALRRSWEALRGARGRSCRGPRSEVGFTRGCWIHRKLGFPTSSFGRSGAAPDGIRHGTEQPDVSLSLENVLGVLAILTGLALLGLAVRRWEIRRDLPWRVSYLFTNNCERATHPVTLLVEVSWGVSSGSLC
jgi:hypothetical protein